MFLRSITVSSLIASAAVAGSARADTFVVGYSTPALDRWNYPFNPTPGTRIVAHDYGFEKWQPDRKQQISKTYMLYVVPARVAGGWQIEAPLTRGREFLLDLQQQYQQVRGGVRVQGGFLPAFEARMDGGKISFVLVEDDVSYRFEGTVDGDAMAGVVRYGYGPKLSEQSWRARHVRAPASSLI